MTSASPEDREPTPPYPAGRYGRRRTVGKGRRHRLLPALVTVVVVIGVLAGYQMYRTFAGGGITSQVNSFQLHARSVELSFDVVRSPGAKVRCGVKALGVDQATVGQSTVDVPASGTRVRTVTYTLRTTARPVSADVGGCAEVR